MATQYSNKPIVTDGLVYALDFGNPKSYVSGSATAQSLIYRPTPARFETLLPGDYGTPAAAYSVRKVVSSYTGSAMMVQSASVSQSIGFDADGNLDTASIASFAGSGDAFVKIWYDQSGNNRHASQSVAANQPQIVSGGNVILENGKPALQFDGSNDFLRATRLLTNNTWSFFTSIKIDSMATAWNLIGQHSGGANIGRLQIIANDVPSSKIRTFFNNGASFNGLYSNTVSNNKYLVSSLANNNDYFLAVNGSIEEIISNQTLTPHDTNFTIGALNNGDQPYNGKIQEIIGYTSDQSSNRIKIEDNINEYYQIYTGSYNPTPDPDNDFLDFESNSGTLNTQQTFPGFSYNQGNSTIMYVGETKGNSTTFTQDGTLSIVSTTSSVGFGSPSNTFGRSYPVTGLKHVALRFSSGSVDCFVNGIPVSASAIFPTGSSIAGGQLNIPLYTGSLGGFQIYNRPLTSDEIWNNYQLSAPRYGLGPVQNKPYTLDENAYLFLQSAGITDPIITSSINTFVLGLKSASLWDKMIAIYPFVGTGSTGINLTGSHRWNLKEPSLVTYPLTFTGSWQGSTSGSAPSGSGTNITMGGVTPTTVYPFYNTQSAHISILSYDTPVSSSYLMGTGMTEDLAVSTLAGDYGTPAAAYSVRKVRTAYSGALMDVRRSLDNVTSSIGYVSNGDLDTGSLLDWVVPGRSTLPGAYSGLAAAYSLRKVSASYSGNAIDVRRDSDNTTSSIGFNATGVLDTGTLLAFVTGSANTGSGFVAQWYDQSGNGRHATQTATSSQPLIVSSGSLITENSKPALRFIIDNSSSLSLPGSPLSGSNAFGLYAVANFLSANPFEMLYAEGTTGNPVEIRRNNVFNTLQWITGDGTFPTGTASIDNRQILVTINRNPLVSNTAFVNGVLDATLTTGSDSIASTTASIGKRTDGYYFDGTIQEMSFFTGSAASSSRALIENNINNYYNIYTGSNHGFVARWYDQSGNNRHASQTATGSQPLIVESGSVITENNKPAVFANQSRLNLPSTLNFNDLGWFIVSKKDGVNNNGVILAGGSGIYAGDDPDLQTSTPQAAVAFSGFISKNLGNSFAFTGVNQHLSYYQRVGSTAVGGYNGLITGSVSGVTAGIFGLSYLFHYDLSSYTYKGKVQELTLYSSDQSSNRGAIEYNINNYYNIYPQTSSFATSSFTIKADSGSISASLNNRLTSGIATSGPLGLITVSRTGSNSLTIARNGVTSSFAVPASGALSTGLYLGAINNNGLALGNSPVNISFASVGTGLTGTDINNLTRVVGDLNFNLGRVKLLDFYTGAAAAYSLRQLSNKYTGPAIEVRRSNDNASASIGFTSDGNLDITTLRSFVGSNSAFVKTWYDQSGNGRNATQTTAIYQPQIISNGNIILENNKPAIEFTQSSPKQLVYTGLIYSTNTVFAIGVATFNNFTANMVILSQNSGGVGRSNLLGTNAATQKSAYFFNNGTSYTNLSARTITSRTQTLMTNYSSNNNYFNALNGSSGNNEITGVSFTPVSAGGSYIGSFNVQFGDALDGKIQEIIAWNNDQSSNKSGIEANINNYYQIY
jgi:hypothetical protein